MSNQVFRPQQAVPATYMRGGTSKGVFFSIDDLPEFAQQPGPERDALLLRVIGSPDPYGKHTDGMGGATSSTSKTVLLSKSYSASHDVDYLFGQVSIDKPFVDWSGNCGNLTAAVGAFAISKGMVEDPLLSSKGTGTVIVRIWQVNIKKTIIAHVPVINGEVQETGDFELDGVTFPAAEVVVEFLDPADGEGALFPTGNVTDIIKSSVYGDVQATLINAGIPTVFVNADALGFSGTELQPAINEDPQLLVKLETLRAEGAVAMGLISDLSEAQARQHTPKLAFVAPPQDYTASSGSEVAAADIDVNVRALSMGKLHHAMMGTAAVAIGAAAAIPGTLVNLASGGVGRESVTFGHPSGTLKVGAAAEQIEGQWTIKKAIMSRSARRLMEGNVFVPL
ncbi:2-methylaconitate cis-trans isomerase PrpF [Alteromonas flava]|uniref:2-methylaconitate cis-trans isomerase PrpF n=1 Tax=Alteromonas flava TaxID=2048003 RepID=UPI000C294E45|nr:2-methylaconitate cis-trans isomerase PrpF [Alteromonas flava]